MKKLIPLLMAALIALITTTPAQGKIPFPYTRSIPIWIEAPLQAAELGAFATLLAVHGAVKILASMAEPLDNYKAGIYRSVRSASATITWPDGDYETRDIDSEQFYDFDPFSNTVRWWEKTTFAVLHRDGTRTETITYNNVPPGNIEFNQEDVHYKRSVMSGCHCSDFSFDSFQYLTGYVIRLGSGAWGRPVTGWFEGTNYNPLWRTDILYHNPTTPWKDSHFVFIGPSSLGTSSLALFKLKFGSPNAEVLTATVVTTIFPSETF